MILSENFWRKIFIIVGLLTLYLSCTHGGKGKTFCHVPPSSPCSNLSLTCPSGKSLYIYYSHLDERAQETETGCSRLTEDNCTSECCTERSQDYYKRIINWEAEARCLGRNRCEGTNTFVPKFSSLSLMEVDYKCEPESRFINAREPYNKTVTANHRYLWYSSYEEAAIGWNCGCEVQSGCSLKQIYGRLATRSCQDVNLTTDGERKLSCDEGSTTYIERPVDVSTEISSSLNLDFNNFTSTLGDYVAVKVYCVQGRITCTGCSNLAVSSKSEQSSSDTTNGISSGYIVVIVTVSCLVVLILILLTVFICRYKRSKYDSM